MKVVLGRSTRRWLTNLVSGLALASAALSCLNAGNAKANITCTFGALGTAPKACNSITVNNLVFSDFTFSGTGVEDSDSVQVQFGSGVYTISFLPTGGGGLFDSNATLNFKVAALNSYTLKDAAANSTMAPATPFTYTYTSASLASPGSLATSGNTTSYLGFTGNPSSANFILSWNVANGVTAGSTQLFLRQNDPSPVPGPLPLFGTATAFGFSRRLRQRVNARA